MAEIMSINVLCVNEDLGVDGVTQLFVDNGISGAPVVDRNGTAITSWIPAFFNSGMIGSAICKKPLWAAFPINPCPS